jgi:hypothetical protein
MSIAPNVRVEQFFAAYHTSYTVEKTGNTVHLTRTDDSRANTEIYNTFLLATEPLRAKFLALW